MLNTFSARLYPKMTKMSLKKSKITNFAAKHWNVAWTACQVVSEPKLNVEHDARMHLAQIHGKCLSFDHLGFFSFQGPKRANSSSALNGFKWTKKIPHIPCSLSLDDCIYHYLPRDFETQLHHIHFMLSRTNLQFRNSIFLVSVVQRWDAEASPHPLMFSQCVFKRVCERSEHLFISLKTLFSVMVIK